MNSNTPPYGREAAEKSEYPPPPSPNTFQKVYSKKIPPPAENFGNTPPPSTLKIWQIPPPSLQKISKEIPPPTKF